MKFFTSLKNKATEFLGQYKGKNPATYAAAQQAIGGVLIADGLTGIEAPFGENKRPGIFGTIGGMVMGIIFILVPTFFGSVSGIKDMTAETSATVVSVSEPVKSDSESGSVSCSLTVNYIVDDQEYTEQSAMRSSGSCSLASGQTILINYDPADPSAWVNDAEGFNMIMLVFFWMGVVALISSIVTFVIRLLSIIFGWKLLRDGRKNASTLPKNTDMQTIINEIKNNFVKSVFGFGGTANPTNGAVNNGKKY